MASPERIALLVPTLPSASEILPWLRQIDENRRYTNFGPLSQAFELALAPLAGARHVVSVSSCTLGLELGLGALDIAPGSQVLVPALTFPATATAVVRAGLKPLFGDVDPRTLSLTPDIARKAAGETQVGAVVPVALHGHLQDAAAWDSFSAETGVPVLIDAAAAAGHQTVGAATAAVFSLHATKPLAVGEGGFVATNDADFAKRIKTASNFGFESCEVRSPGTNAKLSEYHAAVGSATLERWPEWKARRQALYDAYAKALDRPELRGRVRLVTQSSATPNLCVQFDAGIDDRCQRLLAESGIETRRWYWPPLHRHAAFAHYKRSGDLRVTDQVSDRLLGLPFHLDLEPRDIARIGDALVRVVE